MLKKLRHKKTAKKIWIFLCILIVPAFVFWGLGGALKSRQESNYVGRIFGKKISLLEYKDALDATRNQAIMQFGDNFSQIQKYLNLESQAWERLLLLAEAKKRKIRVSNEEVIALIESYPFFQRRGQFDNRIYSEMLRYVFGTSARLFEEQTRQNLMLAKLYKEATDNINLKEEEIKEEYRKANEEISIYYIVSLFSDFQKDIVPSEQDIKDYFTRNSLDFKQPLSFNVEYIYSDSEDKIKTVFALLNKKVDFHKATGESGLEIKETGLFSQTDSIPGIGWAPQVLSLISKLKVGEVSPPMHLDKNYYILRLKEIKEPSIPELESIKEKVKEAFIRYKARQTAKDKIENCLKILNEQYKNNPRSIDFDKTAKEYGLKSGATETFKYGSYIEGIGASDKFWLAAQGLKEERVSEIIEMPPGFYIVKLKLRIPIDEKKFETEKTAFTQQLLEQKKQEHFSNFIEELKRKTRLF